MAKLRWSPEAFERTESIKKYIEKESPSAALQFARSKVMRKITFSAMLLIFLTPHCFAQNKKDDDNKPCTRAQFAQLIVDTLPWVKGLPDATKEEIKFKDVDSTHPNYEAIKFMINLYVLEPYPNNFFKPGAPVIRYVLAGELGRLIHRIEEIYKLKFLVLDTQHIKLSDIPDEGWIYLSIGSVYLRGVMTGYPDGTFKGKQPATIKEVKLVLQRIKEKTEALLKEKEK